jgi:hypothetical protein
MTQEAARNSQRSDRTMSSPPPQLARKQYNLCDGEDDDSSSTSSLEIIPPAKAVTQKIDKKSTKSTTDNTVELLMESFDSEDELLLKSKQKSTTDNKVALLMESSDSEDELLLKSKPIFSRKSSATKRNANVTTTATRTIATTTASTYSLSNNNSSTGETRDEVRLRKKRETEKRNEVEKLARARKREQERAERERKKLEEKGKKKRQLEEFQQSSGKYANQEITVLMDPVIYNNEEFNLVGALNEDFLLHPQNTSFNISKAIQWIRKDYLQGGAKDALKQLEQDHFDQFEHLPYFLLLLEPDDFIPLLKRDGHDVDDDYPALENYLAELKSRWQLLWKTSEEPRIIFLLYQIPKALDHQWINHRRSKRTNASSSPPTEWELNDAIQWLLVQFQVECIHCSTIESMQSNIHKLTRGICEGRYCNKVTELQCIKKIKQATTGDRPIDRARDVWFRQLQQVPRISEAIALNVVQQYPTMQSLWQVYQQSDDATNSALVEDILSDRSRQTKLSHSLYRILMSKDPKEMLS